MSSEGEVMQSEGGVMSSDRRVVPSVGGVVTNEGSVMSSDRRVVPSEGGVVLGGSEESCQELVTTSNGTCSTICDDVEWCLQYNP